MPVDSLSNQGIGSFWGVSQAPHYGVVVVCLHGWSRKRKGDSSTCRSMIWLLLTLESVKTACGGLWALCREFGLLLMLLEFFRGLDCQCSSWDTRRLCDRRPLDAPSSVGAVYRCCPVWSESHVIFSADGIVEVRVLFATVNASALRVETHWRKLMSAGLRFPVSE